MQKTNARSKTYISWSFCVLIFCGFTAYVVGGGGNGAQAAHADQTHGWRSCIYVRAWLLVVVADDANHGVEKLWPAGAALRINHPVTSMVDSYSFVVFLCRKISGSVLS
jgi:hypothetical protein